MARASDRRSRLQRPLENISRSLQQGWVLTTDYSGIGTAEEAARCLSIAAACKAHGEGRVQYAARVLCQRAGDKKRIAAKCSWSEIML